MNLRKVSSIVIVCGVFVILLGKKGYGLECFTCSSQLAAGNYIGECENFSYNHNHKKSMCMYGQGSVCAKYIVSHEGMTWVHRSCQPPDICSYLAARYSNDRNQLLECTTCSDKDLCNSSSKYRISMIIAVVTAAFVRIINSIIKI